MKATPILVAALAAGAHAQVIDFQVLEHVDNLTVNHGYSYSEDGFDLNTDPNNPFEFATFGTLEARYPGSTALFNNTVGGINELTAGDGSAFDLESIDLAPLNNGGTPVTVVFQGFLNGNAVANQTFTTSAIGFVLETFSFSDDFDNVDLVTWSQDSPFHQFDNITIGAGGGCPADLDGDGDADADDFFAYLDAFAGGNLGVCDIDGDGDCDADDFFGYLDLFAQGC